MLGAITLESEKQSAFNPEEQSFVEQLANQAAVAMANAELHYEMQRHLREQSTLYQVSSNFVRTLDIEATIDIFRRAIAANVSSGEVYIYLKGTDPEGYQLSASNQGENAFNMPNALRGKTITKLFQEQERLSQISSGQIIADLFPDAVSVEQVLTLPLRVAEQLYGLVVLCFPEHFPVPEETTRLLQAIAAQGSIAIQNALLFSETTQRREQVLSLINSVHESIIMIDRQGRITLSNKLMEQLTGLSREQLNGKYLSELTDTVLSKMGFDRDRLEAFFADLSAQDSPSSPEVKYQVPGLTPMRVMERTTSSVLSPSDQSLGWMIVWRDVTEEHKVDQEREAIAEALIHDLRSPVSAVLGSIDLLDDALPEEERGELVDRSLRVARRGSKRVLRLIESLLDAARMQTGRIELERSPVDIAAMVPELLVDITLLADEYDIEIVSEIPDDLPVIIVDEDKITRVITNLVDNAVKFSPEGGEVRVIATAMPEDVMVQVWDSGPGIREDHRSVIFERFAQVAGQVGRWRGVGLDWLSVVWPLRHMGVKSGWKTHPMDRAAFSL